MDWLGVVESAYRLDGTLDDWLGRLIDAARPVLDTGLGCQAYVYRTSDRRMKLQALTARGILEGREDRMREATESAPIDVMRVMFEAGIVAGSARAMLEPIGAEQHFIEMVRAGTGGAVSDFVGVTAHDGEDSRHRVRGCAGGPRGRLEAHSGPLDAGGGARGRRMPADVEAEA